MNKHHHIITIIIITIVWQNFLWLRWPISNNRYSSKYRSDRKQKGSIIRTVTMNSQLVYDSTRISNGIMTSQCAHSCDSTPWGGYPTSYPEGCGMVVVTYTIYRGAGSSNQIYAASPGRWPDDHSRCVSQNVDRSSDYRFICVVVFFYPVWEWQPL